LLAVAQVRTEEKEEERERTEINARAEGGERKETTNGVVDKSYGTLNEGKREEVVNGDWGKGESSTGAGEDVVNGDGEPVPRTFADAEAEEVAALNVGAGASVDRRLLRLFELLSGDPETAEAAVRVRAAQLLDEHTDTAPPLDEHAVAAILLDEHAVAVAAQPSFDDAGVDAGADAAFAAAEATQLANRYRARRRALLSDIA
jgi:hypothetical protein